jgi:hypothetical protein
LIFDLFSVGKPLNLLYNTRRVLAASTNELATEIANTIDSNHPELPFVQPKEE